MLHSSAASVNYVLLWKRKSQYIMGSKLKMLVMHHMQICNFFFLEQCRKYVYIVLILKKINYFKNFSRGSVFRNTPKWQRLYCSKRSVCLFSSFCFCLFVCLFVCLFGFFFWWFFCFACNNKGNQSMPTILNLKKCQGRNIYLLFYSSINLFIIIIIIIFLCLMYPNIFL
jgi:hypothetical protein